jgi:threonine dehydrogenase-like Zn-dependent dehydrogenase
MMAHFVYKELTLIGSWAGTVPEHFELVDLIRAGLPVDRILTHRFGMDDAPLALDTFFGGQAVKVAIHPWNE